MKALDYKTSKAYLRDSFIDFESANLSIASSPVLYGLSVYTVFNVSWDEPHQRLIIFRPRDHYDRLISSSSIMDFNSFADDWPYPKFEKLLVDLLKHNQVKEDVLVRVSVFVDELVAGTRLNGLTNSLSAYIYPKGEILKRSGANLCVSSWTRTSDNSIPSRAKVNGSYINASLMKNEALQNGYDDAISIDQHGHVAESTVANIFIIRGGKLITPDSSTDILEGITRDSVLQLAQELGLQVVERSVDRSELYVCDEAFLSGSSADIVPILSIDRRPIGNGKAGNLTKQIAKEYELARLAKNRKHEKWCMVVECP